MAVVVWVDGSFELEAVIELAVELEAELVSEFGLKIGLSFDVIVVKEHLIVVPGSMIIFVLCRTLSVGRTSPTPAISVFSSRSKQD